MMSLRADLRIMSAWIQPKSRLLDLGCGDGALLKYLKQTRQVQGYGLEIKPNNIATCIRNGVNVIQKDLNDGLEDFGDQSFDYVVMTQALQAMEHPDILLEDMLRVGRQGIVTFPNFGYWENRIKLLYKGFMPVSVSIPHQWYDTPNIHLCTLKDFEQLCRVKKIKIIQRSVVDLSHQSRWLMKIIPNWFGQIALYHFKR